MKLIPLADRVVVKLVEAEEKTKAGIILTAAAQEKPQIAEVVAVGPGGMVDGKEADDRQGRRQSNYVQICRNRSQMRRRRVQHRASERHSGYC